MTGQVLTIQGLEETIQALYHLVNVDKVKNGEDLRAARAQGDLSENADYDAARDEQARIESDIKVHEAILKNYKLINIDKEAEGYRELKAVTTDIEKSTIQTRSDLHGNMI